MFFEKIKINPATAEIKEAALLNGFDQNGNEEYILYNLDAPKKHQPRGFIKQSKKPVPEAYASAETQIKILQYLIRNPSTVSVLQSDISKPTGIGIMTVRAVINEFNDAGFVEKEKCGISYRIRPNTEKIKQKLTEIGVETPS